MPCPHLLNSLITSVLNSFAYELELKYTYVFKSTEICYRQLSAQWWCLQGFLLVMNKCFYWYGWELEGYICLWWKAWLENNLFWDRLLYKAKLWLCSSLFSWWAIVLKTQGLVSSERWGKIVRNKSRAIIHYQPLSSSTTGSHLETSPAGCAFKHHVPCLLRKGQVWNDKQRGTNRIS